MKKILGKILLSLTGVSATVTACLTTVNCGNKNACVINIVNNENIKITHNSPNLYEKLVLKLDYTTDFIIDTINIQVGDRILLYQEYDLNLDAKTITIDKKYIIHKNIDVNINVQVKPEVKIKSSIKWDSNIQTASVVSFGVGENIVVKYSPKEKYELQDAEIKVGGSKLENTQYCINSNNNTILIYGESVVDENVEINLISEALPEETAQEFIYDRTFSIKASKESGEGCLGTGWILSDATKDDPNDFKYWMVTNKHVEMGFKEYGFKNMGYATSNSTIPLWNGYTLFGQDCISFEPMEVSKFNDGGIDLSIAKVDMKNATGGSKEKLLRLNKLTALGKDITPLAEATTKDNHYEKLNTYTGGFPLKNKPTWEYHEITRGILGYISRYDHTIDSSLNFKDTSPQYKSNYDLTSEFMDGGSSGSMLIAKFESQWKVIGIYWGGWSSSKEKTDFYPAYSIFNSSSKNFVENYI